MTPSPRYFSTISVAAIVLSAILSVFISTDSSFAQSTSRLFKSLSAPTAQSTPPVITVACHESLENRLMAQCRQECLNNDNHNQQQVFACVRRCVTARGC